MTQSLAQIARTLDLAALRILLRPTWRERTFARLEQLLSPMRFWWWKHRP